MQNAPERPQTVLTTTVDYDGKTYSASYFVENDLIHAMIGKRTVITALGPGPAELTVKSLLTGHLLLMTRKAAQSARWHDARSTR